MKDKQQTVLLQLVAFHTGATLIKHEIVALIHRVVLPSGT
jgi:hypothetical protein